MQAPHRSHSHRHAMHSLPDDMTSYAPEKERNGLSSSKQMAFSMTWPLQLVSTSTRAASTYEAARGKATLVRPIFRARLIMCNEAECFYVMPYLRKLWHGEECSLAVDYTHTVARHFFWDNSLPLCLVSFYRIWH